MSTLRALTMPKWGIEMVEGTLSDWSIAEGDRIVKGQSIALIETGKIANDVEAELDATVARLIANRGDTLPVGALLAVLATAPASASEVDEFVRIFRAAPGSAAGTAQTAQTSASAQTAHTAEDAARTAHTATPEAPTAAPTARTAASTGQPSAASAAVAPSDIDISPAARALAAERGIDVRTIRGSGRGGRISLQDVERAVRSLQPAPTQPSAQTAAQAPVPTLTRAQTPASPSTSARAAAGTLSTHDDAPTIERFTPMRKAIAQQLTLAKSTIPHFYLRIEVNIDALVSLREQRERAGEPAPGINSWLLRASALALMDVPELNIQVHGEEIHRFKHADIAVAVATERGLVAPIVRAAETKPVHALAAEVKALAERARAGALRAEDLTGGSFSVSNLGMHGIDEFDAIINPPQGAILAIGAARRRPIEASQPAQAEGALRFAPTLKLSLSCDHRAIDGAMGARYLAALRDALAYPARIT
jgi:pyruvate dehydrogenase E2 component (dihydrolipoamide acetyltransferase)